MNKFQWGNMMIKSWSRILFLTVFCLISTSIMTAAQDDTCPTIVQTALANVDELCSDTARNEACYGSLTLTAEAQPDAVDFAFDAPGDIANVADIQSLTLSPMDESTGEWGVSLMRLQANLPDTLPGQNVTVLLFGDVEIKPVQSPPEISVTVGAENSVNVRSGPSTNDSVVGALAAGTTAAANGRNAAGDWLRVRIPDGGLGWVFAELVSGDASTLDVVSADDSAFTPMQAFYFQSGIGDAPCAEAPDSGILIQTPKGLGQIALTVNEVNISLGSTAYLQAQPGDVMTISVLEGQATVSAFDVTQTVPAGSQATVPLDENLAASGPPTETQPYIEDDLQTLPVDVLPSSVESDVPVSETTASEPVSSSGVCTVTAPGAVNLRSGPGTAYAAAGGIDAGNSVAPTGQAMGTDGYVWYQTASGSWVRSDVVKSEGNCGSLPVVSDVPPTPEPVVSDSSSESAAQPVDSAPSTYCPKGNPGSRGPNFFDLNDCTIHHVRPYFVAGECVTFKYGLSNPEWFTSAPAEEAFSGQSGVIAVDGGGLPVFYEGINNTWHPNGVFGNGVLADWVATAGTHTIYGAFPGMGMGNTCTLVVN
jgi:uncharacterized protein YraI